ncbi:uncharacterized protein Dana_GF17357, isoform A [Drosophila ananassae]|uniref:Fibroblast growth factor n=1 Tax=Drosophila ananassae TaxID=7217 RepID=B3LXR9_DROAN|nr:uncharacterized protein LOC6500142 isoform X1 [Drosophila ananassae]EDV41726.1 uncharacterized protein Dana_GF17357, isoform A [Drosophila ananassae]
MRRNLRLDWRALALLGALLAYIIPWPGLGQVGAMPALIGNPIPDMSNANNSNLLSNSYLQSDHSRSSLVPSVVSERNSVNPPENQSIIAEFNPSLTIQSTALETSTEITPQSNTNQLEEPMGFVISAVPSAHLAVLSRTERSIRHQEHQQQKQQKHHHHQQHQPTSAGNNFIGSKSKRLSNSRSNLQINSSSNNTPISNLDRNERSTVAQSHLDWNSRKIQLFVNRHILQLMRNGTVTGTQDENNEFTILQRSTVDVGRIKLQSVATCLYLCMDACGIAYGSKDFTDDCVFNENMGLQNYNTYTSTYNSNSLRVFYLALNNQGGLRRTQIPPGRALQKMTIYTNVITETVAQERVEQLIAKNFGANRVKHGVRQLCDTGKPLIELIDAESFKTPHTCNPKSGSGSGKGGSNSRSSSKNGSISSSSRSSSSLTSSRNVPVPALRPGSLISISNSSQSVSGHISSSISSSTTNSSNSTNSSSPTGHHKIKGNKNKKRRLCKPNENEEQHHCRKLGPKAQKCKELREKAAAEGTPPPKCGKKNGPRKNQGADVAEAKGIQQQRPKQLGGGGKRKAQGKAGKQRQGGPKKHQPQNPQQAHHAKGSKRRQRKMEQSSTSSTTMASSLATPESRWESSSPLPALALSETSDRVERNVRMSSGEEDPDQDQDQDTGEGDEEAESLEDASYEDGSSEAQGRSGASGDDSLYYDFLVLLIPLVLLQMRVIL